MKFFLSLLILFFAMRTAADPIGDLERRYGLPPGLLAAIALVESANGTICGDQLVMSVFADNDAQFHALKHIAKHTRRPLMDFIGSAAGAMGVMQIQPVTFRMYGQDGDGDGVKDPLNPQDNLATAAYYLTRLIAKYGCTEALLIYSGRAPNYVEKVQTHLAQFAQNKENE
jgi:membrane-bound lytic murein transglycosylase B